VILFLSKLLPLPLYPLGLGLVLVAGAIAALLIRRVRWAVILLSVALGEMWFFSTPIVGNQLLLSLERRYESRAPATPCSTIVLLGGAEASMTPPRVFPETNAGGDRILHAARLYQRGIAPRILVTCGNISFLTGDTTPLAYVDSALLAELMAVDPTKIIVETKAKNTHDHPPLVAALLKERGLPLEVILVTSALHMPRSVAVFKKYGYIVHPAPTDYRAETGSRMNIFSFIPNANALEESTAAIREYYGLVAYRVLGWI